MAPGRPSTFTKHIGQAICDRLAAGEPLTQICRDEGFPTDRTVRNWMTADADFASDIARARELGFDAIASRLRDTARGRGESTQDVQRDKLIIDTDLKLLAKWDPKRYGEKLAVGGDPDGPPIKTSLTVSFV